MHQQTRGDGFLLLLIYLHAFSFSWRPWSNNTFFLTCSENKPNLVLFGKRDHSGYNDRMKNLWFLISFTSTSDARPLPPTLLVSESYTADRREEKGNKLITCSCTPKSARGYIKTASSGVRQTWYSYFNVCFI